jgi:CRISPR-associated protein Csx17
LPEVVLSNCRIEPWASYLRGLAVLRLVAEQKDAEAKGCFRDDRFILTSSLDKDSLLDFFVKEYRPTPVVSPWNGGSGFYPKDDKTWIERICGSNDPRFERYSQVIEQVRSWPELPNPGRSLDEIINIAYSRMLLDVGGHFQDLYNSFLQNPSSLLEEIMKLGLPKSRHPYEDIFSALQLRDQLIPENEWDIIKRLSVEDATKLKNAKNTKLIANVKKIRTKMDERSRKGIKELLLRKCRSTLPLEAIRWTDTAMIVDGVGEARYPPLLGGGNEGNLEYSRTFMNYVGMLLLSLGEKDSRELLSNSLLGDRTNKYSINVMGMFDPGRAGGFNQGVGIESKNFPANPWDFVLAIEGSMLWASSITRREGDRTGVLASPFTTRSMAVGYTSASDLDEAPGTYELWAPIWDRPTGLREARYLMAEGRAYTGRSIPQQSMQFVIALANLGADRGIREFARYGIFKRRGDNKVIMPLGRHKVHEVPKAHLLEELEPIIQYVDRFMHQFKGQPPASLDMARKGIDHYILKVVAQGSTTSFKELLMAVGRLERMIGRRNPFKEPRLIRPLGGLSLEWLLACDDGSPEIRLAGAISSLYDKGLGPWRAQMEQVDPKRPYAWSEKKGSVSWGAGSIYRNLAASLHWRILLSSGQKDAHPLRSSISLHPRDAMVMMTENLDHNTLDDLLWGMTWIDWSLHGHSMRALRAINRTWWKPLSPLVVPRGWTMLSATLSPDGLVTSNDEHVVMGCEPEVASLLMAERYPDAVRLAHRRLYAAGVPVRMAVPNEDLEGIKVAASLLVPARFVDLKSVCLLEKGRR